MSDKLAEIRQITSHAIVKQKHHFKIIANGLFDSVYNMCISRAQQGIDYVYIRASNFGRLNTFTPEEKTAVLTEIENIFKELGFRIEYTTPEKLKISWEMHYENA